MALSKARRRVFAGLGVLTVPALVACNGILGLNDYSTQPCSGGGTACLDSGFGGDGSLGDGGNGTEGGRGSQPVSWAAWPMPNYPDASGDKLPIYQPNNDGTVTDTITGLVWQAQPSVIPQVYDDAQATCAALTLQNAKWRLPKRIELVTLLDYTVGKPFISTVFKPVPPAPAWTSSEFRTVDDSNTQTVTNDFWTVGFGDGVVTHATADKTQLNGFAFCVKAQ